MDNKALYNINCGLFVLTSELDGRQNGCIINTVMQVTSSPVKISATVNKSNFTAEMILKSRRFCISCIDESADFSLFKRFGFASGREVDKLDGYNQTKLGENGVLYVTESANAYMEAEVTDVIDVGTHYVFIAEVTQAGVLSDKPSASYSYYHANIKPKPEKKKSAKTRWVCKICGYVYEGDELPADFICPICKHPASDFEKAE